jgi:hypothetical protein
MGMERYWEVFLKNQKIKPVFLHNKHVKACFNEFYFELKSRMCQALIHGVVMGVIPPSPRKQKKRSAIKTCKV